jgi:hypothetical protein
LFMRRSVVMGSDSFVSGVVYVCPEHPFLYVVDGYKFSLRVTDDFVIIDIRFLVFGGYLLVFSLGSERCKV